MNIQLRNYQFQLIRNYQFTLSRSFSLASFNFSFSFDSQLKIKLRLLNFPCMNVCSALLYLSKSFITRWIKHSCPTPKLKPHFEYFLLFSVSHQALVLAFVPITSVSTSLHITCPFVFRRVPSIVFHKCMLLSVFFSQLNHLLYIFTMAFENLM